MHIGKPESTDSDSCMFPFSDVPVWQMMTSEFIGSAILGIAPGLIVENPTLVNLVSSSFFVKIVTKLVLANIQKLH
jgi:hypothetical protein